MPGCHGGGSPAQGLNLSSLATWSATVGVRSSQQPSVNLVLPGSANVSYFMWKINNDARANCCRMPPGPALSAQEIADLAAWINSGAPNN